MNPIISQLNAEFEKMENTINFQKKIIETATCVCWLIVFLSCTR